MELALLFSARFPGLAGLESRHECPKSRRLLERVRYPKIDIHARRYAIVIDLP